MTRTAQKNNPQKISFQKILPTYKNSISEIKKYFDDLDKNETHFVNSNDICTPFDCVVEMVDKIPKDFFKNKNLQLLDPCCGNGNFHAYLSQKTPLKNLYFNDINKKRLFNIKKFFGANAQITSVDFLEMDETKKYDLVVANPPYAKINDGKRASKNHNMSRDFIRKALKITKQNGFILFIVPNNWMSFSDRNDLPKMLSQYQFIHINEGGAKKYFPKVGSSFSWFLLQKCENKMEANRIKKELESEIFKFIVNITRYGNFNNIRVLQNLSILNSFELNNREQKIIKKFNMAYYGKKNIVPLRAEDLKDEIKYNDFQYKKHFFHLCNLIPNKEKEKLEIEAVNDFITKHKRKPIGCTQT